MQQPGIGTHDLRMTYAREVLAHRVAVPQPAPRRGRPPLVPRDVPEELGGVHADARVVSPADGKYAAAVLDLDFRRRDLRRDAERVHLALQGVGVQAVLGAAMIAQPEWRELRRRSRVFPAHLDITADDPGRIHQRLVSAAVPA